MKQEDAKQAEIALAKKRAAEEARAKQEDEEAREAEARRKKETIADDLLDGAQEIADELGTNIREVYHLHKTKRLPIGRMGKKLIAFRSQLRRAARALTATQKDNAA